VASLTLPAAGRPGATVTGHVRIAARGRTATLNGDSPAPLEVIQNGTVVGEYNGAVAGTGIGGVLTRSGKSYPVGGVLSGCPTGVDNTAPDSTRKPLPAGTYQLVAIINYYGEHQGGKPGYRAQLVASTPITVT
jgi:hypothetical protein